MDFERCVRILAEVAEESAIRQPASLSDEEVTAILDLARVVAHGVERKAAPLASYAVGRALADVEPERRLAYLRRAIEAIEAAPGEPSSAQAAG